MEFPIYGCVAIRGKEVSLFTGKHAERVLSEMKEQFKERGYEVIPITITPRDTERGK